MKKFLVQDFYGTFMVSYNCLLLNFTSDSLEASISFHLQNITKYFPHGRSTSNKEKELLLQIQL